MRLHQHSELKGHLQEMQMHKFPFYSMTWRAFEVTVIKDEESQIGLTEELKEIQINETIPSWQQSVLDVPALTFDYGLHKLVFRFQVSFLAKNYTAHCAQSNVKIQTSRLKLLMKTSQCIRKLIPM